MKTFGWLLMAIVIASVMLVAQPDPRQVQAAGTFENRAAVLEALHSDVTKLDQLLTYLESTLQQAQLTGIERALYPPPDTETKRQVLLEVRREVQKLDLQNDTSPEAVALKNALLAYWNALPAPVEPGAAVVEPQAMYEMTTDEPGSVTLYAGSTGPSGKISIYSSVPKDDTVERWYMPPANWIAYPTHISLEDWREALPLAEETAP